MRYISVLNVQKGVILFINLKKKNRQMIFLFKKITFTFGTQTDPEQLPYKYLFLVGIEPATLSTVVNLLTNAPTVLSEITDVLK